MTATEVVLHRKEINVPRSIPVFILTLSLSIGLHHLLSNAFGNLHPYVGGLVTLSFFLILGILIYPLGRNSWTEPLKWAFGIDLLLIFFTILGTIYVLWDWEAIISVRVGDPNLWDQAVSSFFIIAVLELSRRCVGLAITIIATFFIFSNIFADHLWGWFYGPPVSWKTTASVIFMVDDGGIFNIPLKVCSEFIVTFMIFVGFMLELGLDQKLIALATSMTGRFTGGPAKIAIMSSAMVGTTQGSPAANVAATGSFTIPLMKTSGFEPAMAGAIESTASTGGQVMPPIMGTTAFLIAAYLNISYFEVCLRALIPTFIYYTCLFMGVHFYAKKRGLIGLPRRDIPSLREGFGTGWPMLLPFAALFIMLASGFGLSLVAVGAVLSLLIASSFRRETRLTAGRIIASLERGAKLAITVVIACAAVGIIIGVFYVSGLGNRMAIGMESVASGNIYIALGLTALICIFLGMGITIPAVYVLMLYITIPALINMGAIPFVAHFFVFMYAVVAAFTPPVGLAIYVASGISGANLMNVGWTSIKLGIALFLIPFFVAINPALLGFGPPMVVAGVIISALLGAILLEAGFEGWLIRRASLLERILLIISGFLLFIPEWKSDAIGILLGGLAILTQKINKN